MGRRSVRVVLVLVAAFGAAQFIRPGRTGLPVDARRTIDAQLGPANGLTAVLDRACRDCHSQSTRWPWYARIAPVSWLMARGVAEGRKAVDFSDWAAYPPERRRALLVASCRATSEGRMPGRPWTLLHPEAKLSATDVRTICAAAQLAANPAAER